MCVHSFTQKLFFTVITRPAWHKGYGVGVQNQLKQSPGPWACSLPCKWKMIISANVNVWSLGPHFCDVNRCHDRSQRDFTTLSLFIQIMTFRTLACENLSVFTLYPALLLTWWDPVNLSLEWYSWLSRHWPGGQLILLVFISNGGLWILIWH